MKKYLFLCLTLFCVALFMSETKAQKFGKYETVKTEYSAELKTSVESAASETIKKFAGKNLKAENLAISVIDLTNPNEIKSANFRGEERIYPASVVKMFYMVALHQWYADGRLKPSPALARAESDMIVHSYNEPTQYIVDALTDTHNGEELSAKDLEKYGKKRDIVNRYFQSLGYKNINVNQKTYEESLYGRERQWWDGGKKRNVLTTDAVARLLCEIALGKAVSKEHSAKMLELMKRDFMSPDDGTRDQAHDFTGVALKDFPTAKLWSKAGWTTETRHDAAYIELPNGKKFIVVIFTTGFANEREILPFAAGKIIRRFAEM